MPLLFDRVLAVCADMDGTLVDTEDLYSDARATAFHQLHGFRPTDEEARAAIGQPDRVTIGCMLATRGINGTVADVIRATNEIYLHLIKERPIVFPDTHAFLARVADAGLPLALVTSAPRLQADAILAILDAREAFKAVITIDDVDQPKPSAEPYLLACERLGVSPSQVLVIEDSTSGVRAGKAAGAYVVAARCTNHPGADACVQTLDELRFRS
jgi:HAD superfamily hydrolase (TIGR01509 family)